MRILVSFCNRQTPESPALALLDPDSLALAVVALPAEVPPLTGITGLAADAHHLYAAVRACEAQANDPAAPSSLLIYDLRELQLLNHHTFRHVTDVHSICVLQDALYVVSTGTDE